MTKTAPKSNNTNKVNRGIKKSEAYIAGIFTPEYDLEEMIIAFGIKEVVSMVEGSYKRLKAGERYNKRHKEAKKIRERVYGYAMIDQALEI